MKLLTTIVAGVMGATLLGACQDASPPQAPGQTSVIDKSAAAPSQAGTPVAPTPATHAAPPPPAPPASATATDSPATEPMATLTKDKESASMPLAGHGNNHSSDSLDAGKDAPK